MPTLSLMVQSLEELVFTILQRRIQAHEILHLDFSLVVKKTNRLKGFAYFAIPCRSTNHQSDTLGEEQLPDAAKGLGSGEVYPIDIEEIEHQEANGLTLKSLIQKCPNLFLDSYDAVLLLD